MIRPYLPGDIWLVLPRIRESELLELQALGGTPEDNLKAGIYNSDTVTIELGGKVCGLAGVLQQDGYLQPWSVFTADICQHPIAFLRECKRWISRYDAPMLNVVDTRNKQAIRWLEWLGFEIGEPESMGVNGELFHVYRKGF